LKKIKIGTITLNRPEVLNAFNEQFVWDFQEATSNVKDDDRYKVVIITGAGKRLFCRSRLN
jgi:2-(1,2-epoxy-1,2-dihydrophenyl)acetyl-CoA isomerase